MKLNFVLENTHRVTDHLLHSVWQSAPNGCIVMINIFQHVIIRREVDSQEEMKALLSLMLLTAFILGSHTFPSTVSISCFHQH